MSVFRRCTRCRPGRWPKGARRCPACGSTSSSWEYVAELGRDGNGKRMRRWKAGFASRAEAERAERELLAQHAAKMLVEQSDQTVAAFLDRWLRTVQPRLAAKTAQEWGRSLERHVMPRIGHVELQKLSPADLSGLYGELLATLSPTTVRWIHARLRQALKDAVRWKLIDRSPADDADVPPHRQEAAARRAAMRIWTEAELRRFLSATRGHRWHVLWTVAAATGLRRSEVLALRWRDIDGNLLTIRQTLVEVDGGWKIVDTTKTGGSARTLPLDRRTVETLRFHARTHDTWRLAAGQAWENVDRRLVFVDGLGRPLSPAAVSQAFRRAVRDVGVPSITFHGVRHTHASLMLRAGVSPKVVSERLGHSSPAYTLSTYAHEIPGMSADAAELFADRVFGGADHSDDGRPTVGQNDRDGDGREGLNLL